MATEIAVLFLAISVLILNIQVTRALKRLRTCEDRHAAIDLLADQVCELSHDFYGPTE